MKQNHRQISGTAGIESSSRSDHQHISYGHYQRSDGQSKVTGRASDARPIDTPLANESVTCQPATKQQVEGLFKQWNDALQTGNAKTVAALYAEDAVLLPTVSNLPRTTPSEIEDYFQHFLQKQPVGKVTQRNIKPGCNKITDAGIYEFTLTSHGKKTVVPARYTFVYEYRHNQWKIVHHHSSMMPESV